MGKFFKWFFGIIIALLIIAVILFCCGILKVKYQTPFGIDITLSIADYQNQDFVNYIKYEQDCTFDGFALDFSGATKKNDSNTEEMKDDFKDYEKDEWDDDEEDDEDDDW